MDIRKLDFSQYHPLDHWIGTTRCYEFYGGPKIHLRYGWDHKWKARLHEETTCKLGFHHFRPGFQRGKPGAPNFKTWTACVYCWKHQKEDE